MIGKKKILIIGASGYLGSWLCYFLHSSGHEIIGSFSSKPSNKNKWTDFVSKFIIGDIRHESTIKEITRSKAQIIIHLVSLNHNDSEKDVDNTFDVNVKPISNILYNSINSSTRIEKFIYFSSVQVYGKNLKGKITESQKVNPNNIYGLTHQISEEICNYFDINSNINCLNIRLSNSYGHPFFTNSKCWNLVINNLVKSAFEKKKVILNSNGKIFKDFIHISEICSFVKSLISSTSFSQNTFNLTSSKTTSLIEIAVEVKKTYFRKYNIEIPIYVNKNELYSSQKQNNLLPVFSFTSNHLMKNYNKTNKNFSQTIEDIFNYLEENQLNLNL